ncbi:MAG TPA: hypothetical protein VFM94_02625 [Solirubrobacterales bacterium]|nr:hypothetical protein [Solirubrobacterales bacterium]
MSQVTIAPTKVTPDRHAPSRGADDSVAKVRPQDIAGMLAMMTFPERVRAYKNETFTRRELSAAAAREPERMPMLNGEFEWIAWNLADLD